MTVALFDPSIASENLGDQIITSAVVDELAAIMPNQQIIHLPTQERIGSRTFRIARQADWRIVGGTNLLSSHMLRYRQWNIGLLDALRLPPVILCGVGWWQYQDDPDVYTRMILRKVLAKDFIHSVRDDYTKEKLLSIGVKNVVNTGCPTTWKEGFGQMQATRRRGNEVVFTLTDYAKDRTRDQILLETLLRKYERVWFWPQGREDRSYLSTFDDAGRVEIVPPSTDAFDSVLARPGINFIGTRLHAGIRAIQRRVPSLVIAIDNRSVEMAKSNGLPVLRLTGSDVLHAAIGNLGNATLSVNFEMVKQWRGQFE